MAAVATTLLYFLTACGVSLNVGGDLRVARILDGNGAACCTEFVALRIGALEHTRLPEKAYLPVATTDFAQTDIRRHRLSRLSVAGGVLADGTTIGTSV